jgi:hypothetical protein
MIARHLKKPPDEVMMRLYNSNKKIYKASFESELIRIIQQETGINALAENNYRARRFVEARAIFAVMLAKHTMKTYTQIGNLIGKDHSSITHLNTMVMNMIDTDKKFCLMYDRINLKAGELKR